MLKDFWAHIIKHVATYISFGSRRYSYTCKQERKKERKKRDKFIEIDWKVFERRKSFGILLTGSSKRETFLRA